MLSGAALRVVLLGPLFLSVTIPKLTVQYHYPVMSGPEGKFAKYGRWLRLWYVAVWQIEI